MSSKFYITMLLASGAASVLATAGTLAIADEVTETQRTVTTTTTSDTPGAPDETRVIKKTTVIENAPVVPEEKVVVTERVVPLSMSDSQLILQTVDRRRNALDKEIVDARSAGTITEAQAASYRRELDRIGSELTFLQSMSRPSLTRAVVLAEDLDGLTRQMRSGITTITYVPIIEGSHFTIFNGRIVEIDEPAMRRIALENKILEQQAAGRLSFEQANSLRSELNTIAVTEDAYRANGPLSNYEAREIFKSMDRVGDKLDSEAHLR